MLNLLVRRRPLAVLALGALVGLSGRPVRAADDQPQTPPQPEPLSGRQMIIHVLNRCSYGPRPGDVEWVEKMGLPAYMRQQLHPETIDDSALRAELSKFDALNMSATELFRDFREQQEANKQRQIEKANAEKGAATMTGASTNSATPEIIRGGQGKRAGGGEPPRRSQIAVAELQDAKIISAVDSPRQLYEVLVDFWSNHFNIDVRKGPCRVLKVADERDVIRPHVFGKFRDLLGASAKSPAMLHYLDNFQNSAPREVSPNEQRRRQQFAQQIPGAPVEPVDNKPKQVGGINENYAREIMELHTLGVDGGYTQKDVQEVARC